MKNSARMLVLFCAFVMSWCFGANYCWSIFSSKLNADYGFSMTAASSVFAVFQLAFSVAFITGGRIMDKIGPGKAAFIGGVIQGVGYFSAGLFEPSPWL